MQPHFRDVIEWIRYDLNEADDSTEIMPEQIDISHIISAIKQLTDLSERLYGRILDLEKVQNERAEEQV